MNFLQTFIGAFSSATMYRQVRLRANYEMGYSFLLVAVSTLLLVVATIIWMHGELFTARAGRPALFDDLVHQVAAQMPLMTLQNGQLMTREARSHTITLRIPPHGKNFAGIIATIATIDTTGTTTRETMKTPVLVTAKDIIIHNKDKTEIHSVADYTKSMPSTLVINRALIDDVAATIIRGAHRHLALFYLIVGGMTWVLIGITFYLMRITMVMALGGAGMLIGMVVKVPVNYAAAVSLAAVSYTPVALIDFLLMLSVGRPPSTHLLFVGGIAMLTVALISSRDETNEPI